MTSSAGTADPTRMNWPGAWVIDRAAHPVPDPRLELPFVDEARGIACEHETRVDPGEIERFVVDIEANHGCRVRFTRRRLP